MTGQDEESNGSPSRERANLLSDGGGGSRYRRTPMDRHEGDERAAYMSTSWVLHDADRRITVKVSADR